MRWRDVSCATGEFSMMLIVYEDEYAMEEAENEKGYKIEGFPSYYHSGLTPPMQKVVQRRYLSRFEERETKPIPPQPSVVSEVEKELQDLIAKFSTGKGKQKRSGASGPASSGGKVKEIKEVEEEIVDYEPWMGDGGIFTVDEAKMHPECWLTKAEVKEIDATKKVLEEERRAREREAADEARRAEEEERRRAEEKAEKKKRKKEKRKKKQAQGGERTSAVGGATSPGPPGDGKKKGIPSMKNREQQGIPAVASSAAAVPGLGELPLDDLTMVARTIHEGVEDEDFLLEDEMFDFSNDDINFL
mmetsp:Transcript_50188/g.106870  ORF Transcript_50188/g.106870 Transcript_50188/m.106870 type:complete len:303 (+) Transcript_50188:286-1194(+)